jgi:hypothetical protein
MVSIDAGKPPLSVLLDMSTLKAFEKTLENQCGIVSIIPALEIARLVMFTCHCSQAGNKGPIWQPEKNAPSNLNVG